MSNPLRGLGISNDLNYRKVKVYDVDKKELIGEFKSLGEAGRFAGISGLMVSKYIQKKHRCHTNSLGKILAFR